MSLVQPNGQNSKWAAIVQIFTWILGSSWILTDNAKLTNQQKEKSIILIAVKYQAKEFIFNEINAKVEKKKIWFFFHKYAHSSTEKKTFIAIYSMFLIGFTFF